MEKKAIGIPENKMTIIIATTWTKIIVTHKLLFFKVFLFLRIAFLLFLFSFLEVGFSTTMLELEEGI